VRYFLPDARSVRRRFGIVPRSDLFSYLTRDTHYITIRLLCDMRHLGLINFLLLVSAAPPEKAFDQITIELI
jgi:hypothetical protein